MNAEDVYRLIRAFAKMQQLDPHTAAWLLERILKALFPERGGPKEENRKVTTSHGSCRNENGGIYHE